MKISLQSLLLLAFSSCACGLTRTQREAICRTEEAKCIWLNDHFSRPHGLPLHDVVEYSDSFHIFCYDGFLSYNTLLHIWDSLHITIETATPRTLVLRYGNTSHVIVSGRGSAHNNSAPLLLNPFAVNCVGVSHVGGSTTYFSVDAKLELWMPYPVLLVVGLILLFMAPRFSKNVPLIYGTGITIGILASFLILLYYLSRYIPGKSFMGLGFLAGGYTLVGGVVYWFFLNMTEILHEHWNYVLGYGVLAGLISFAAMYRWGGVSNQRTFDLIQWSMQLLGVLLIYLSMPVTEGSVVMVLVALLSYVIPVRWNPLVIPLKFLFWLLLTPFRRCLQHPPPRRHFLTEKEFHEQGKVETEKELKKLKQHLKTDRKAMSTISDAARGRVRDFVFGDQDHVNSDERVLHWWTFSADDDDSAPSEKSSSPHHSFSDFSPPSTSHSRHSRHSRHHNSYST